MSPIVDITYTRAPAGEKCFDALIQEVRVNLSVPFVMHLARYIMDSLPGEQIEEGIINHGYENNNSTTVSNSTCSKKIIFLANSITTSRTKYLFVNNDISTTYTSFKSSARILSPQKEIS